MNSSLSGLEPCYINDEETVNSIKNFEMFARFNLICLIKEWILFIIIMVNLL